MGKRSAYLTFAFLTAGAFYFQKNAIVSALVYEQTPLKPNDQTKNIPAPEPPKTGSIIIGGDMMLVRTVESRAVATGSWTTPLQKIRGVLGNADCRVVNLESPFKSNKPRTPTGSLVFAAKPESIEALTSANITAVSLANNHITDQGLAGLQETKELLREKGIVFAGAGETQAEALKSQTIKCGDFSVGLVFASYGTNFPAQGVYVAPLDEIIPSIQKVSKESDFTIVYAHWGGEYQTNPTMSQKEFAHQYIEAGADLIVGGHPHILQPIEMYKKKVIAYSLGNLVFDQEAQGPKTESILLKVKISEKEVDYKIIPLKIKNYFQPVAVDTTTVSHYLKALQLSHWQWSLAR